MTLIRLFPGAIQRSQTFEFNSKGERLLSVVRRWALRSASSCLGASNP